MTRNWDADERKELDRGFHYTGPTDVEASVWRITCPGWWWRDVPLENLLQILISKLVTECQHLNLCVRKH